MSDYVKIGLIGAGVFAGYHANKLASHPRIKFTGVMDRNAKRASELAERHNIKAVSLKALLRQSDAVIIAAPATSHGPIAIEALKAGRHCLIEKPIAVRVEEAQKIIALKTAEDLVVQIGHQERMIMRAIGLDAITERPVKIEAVRNSPYSLRGTDTSVTLDLMTHDIDLCTALMKGPPAAATGQSECVRSHRPDMSYAQIFYDGAKAVLEASRVADISKRVMKITYPSGVVEIDFNAKTVVHSTAFALNTKFADDARAQDSLGAATDIFVRAILDKSPVLVTAEDGAIAARIALKIDGER